MEKAWVTFRPLKTSSKASLFGRRGTECETVNYTPGKERKGEAEADLFPLHFSCVSYSDCMLGIIDSASIFSS